jgi:hypothetical protein
MSNVPRGWRTDEDRQLADATRWPVLARLPDASADSLAGRSAKVGVPGGIEYRFDPPQSGDSGSRTSASVPSSISQQPHMFERGRLAGQRGIPRRESSVLPRSNPFANPRPRLVDSVAPAVRFLTMAALFTAAGIWIQMLGRHAQPTRSIEPPKTAAQPAVAPAKNAVDHTIPAPTATGPIENKPEPGARVGRVEGDDFASQNNSAAGPVPTARPTVTPPHFLISAGSRVPRVRVADSSPAATADSSAQGATASANDGSQGESTDGTESDGSPEVARYPGFMIDIPTR